MLSDVTDYITVVFQVESAAFSERNVFRRNKAEYGGAVHVVGVGVLGVELASQQQVNYLDWYDMELMSVEWLGRPAVLC